MSVNAFSDWLGQKGIGNAMTASWPSAGIYSACVLVPAAALPEGARRDLDQFIAAQAVRDAG